MSSNTAKTRDKNRASLISLWEMLGEVSVAKTNAYYNLELFSDGSGELIYASVRSGMEDKTLFSFDNLQEGETKMSRFLEEYREKTNEQLGIVS